MGYNRKNASSRGHKRHFSRTAAKVHPRNNSNPMRGGIRL